MNIGCTKSTTVTTESKVCFSLGLGLGKKSTLVKLREKILISIRC